MQPVFHFIPQSRLAQRVFHNNIEICLAAQALQFRAISYVLIDALRKGIRPLKHHAHFTTQHNDVYAVSEDILVVNYGLTRNPHATDVVVHAVKGTQESRLARARRPDNCRNLLFGEFH